MIEAPSPLASRSRSQRHILLLLVAMMAARCLEPYAVAATESVKIGIVKFAASCPVYLAHENGYFAREGLAPNLVFFAAAQPVAVAAVAGDIDFGVAALTAGFYNLAGRGALRIIAAQSREVPGFKNVAYLVSNRAYQAGLTSLRELPGRRIAVTQIGSSYHYALGLLAEKYGFELASVRVVPLQTTAAQAAAVSGGRVDAALLSATAATPLIERGVARVIGWVGEETPWQLGAVFAATKTADHRGETVERFLRAYRSGARDCHDAFAGADEKPHDGAFTEKTLDILAKYTGQPVARVRLGIPYIDRDARLDGRDILRQIAWYKLHRMVDVEVEGESLVDWRYARPLPDR